jgi:catechol 2,3-dioxygenase-like lactoylglutathione lyase family enzyme
MTLKGFHHLAIQVRSLEAVSAFYREVLGLPELKRHYRDDGSLRAIWLGAGAGDAFLALEEVRGEVPTEDFPTPRPGLFLVALAIDAGARAGIRAALVKRGVRIEKESAWTLYVRDPEGNRVGLSHYPEPARPPGG